MGNSTAINEDGIRTIAWVNGQVELLDQRDLPQQENYRRYSRCADLAQAIRDMVVRGAPAIGVTAAYGVVLAAAEAYRSNPNEWRVVINAPLADLASARPTAVNLAWALEFMAESFDTLEGDPQPSLLARAKALHQRDLAANVAMGEYGASLMEQPVNVLTHCNTGSLATGGFGTALGVIRTAHQQGKVGAVFADETRPWLQGARLTAWELIRSGIEVQLVADSAAAYLMQIGRVDWVIVGADRIAANGDVANKIGTYSLAIAARANQAKFMVAAPTSTIDLSINNGSAIPIEDRPAAELLQLDGKPIAARGSKAWNPVFDITQASLIDFIVTEKGIVATPDEAKIRALMES